jgi:lipoprotein-anchoring transpeptidase ErfK/SrfK
MSERRSRSGRNKRAALAAAILLAMPAGSSAFSDTYAFDEFEPPTTRIILPPTQPPLPRGARATPIVVDKSWRRQMLQSKGKVLGVYRFGLGDYPIGHNHPRGHSRTPEGVYRIEFKNDRSKFHLSLRVSYPSHADRVHARKLRVHPGSDIMVHGTPTGASWWQSLLLERDWTDGCIAVTNMEIEEIWKLVAVGTPIDIRP